MFNKLIPFFLLLGLALPVQAQSPACVDSSGNSDSPICDSDGNLGIASSSTHAEDTNAASGSDGTAIFGVYSGIPSTPPADAGDFAFPYMNGQGAWYVDQIVNGGFTTSELVVTAAATNYAAGDAVGTIQNGNLARTNANGITIKNVIVSDKDGKAKNLTLVVFEAEPGSTTFTDNAAAAIHNDDLTKICAVIPLTSHKVFNGANGISKSGEVNVKCDQATRVYYWQLIADEAITFYSATDAVSIQMTTEQD